MSENQAMVECAIRAHDGHAMWEDVLSVRRAQEAVSRVMGEGRKVERGADEAAWLVEFTPAELEVLESQGYIDLEKGPFEIVAEMP
ncbi:MAG TPA: hypothetical protein VN712_04175 [Dermatophilaceae bacterium]|nr:hypothetical protein [Dermatophilaceae bacterium]